MNIDKFYSVYKPVINHLDDNASLDGYMFETYDSELEYVKSQPDNLIWTYCDDGDSCYLISGFHLVNRLGYLIASKPFNGEAYTTINEHNWDDVEGITYASQ